MGSIVVNVRMEESDKERLENEAKDRQINFSELLREKICSTPRMYQKLEKWVKQLSELTGFAPHTIVENTLIGVIASRDAEHAVYGDFARTLDEFQIIETGVITGDELYQRIFDERLQEYKERRERELLQSEAAGAPLDDDEKTFLIGRRKGRAWLESDEFRAASQEYEKIRSLALEARQSGLVPKECKKSDTLIAELWSSYKAGRLPEQDFVTMVSQVTTAKWK